MNYPLTPTTQAVGRALLGRPFGAVGCRWRSVLNLRHRANTHLGYCTTPGTLRHRLWNRRFHPFNVYTEKKRREKRNYLHNNPAKRGWVKKPGDWRRSSWRYYFLTGASLLAMDRVP